MFQTYLFLLEISKAISHHHRRYYLTIDSSFYVEIKIFPLASVFYNLHLHTVCLKV